MSNSQQPESRQDRVALVRRLEALTRSRLLGGVLAGLALVFVFLSWRSMDLSGLADVSFVAVGGAMVCYAVAVSALAYVLVVDEQGRRGDLIGAGLATQVLKYIPGSVWQAQGIAAVGGGRLVARFAAVVLFGSGLGLVVSGHPILVAVGCGISLVVFAVGVRVLGLVTSMRIGLLCIVFCSGIFASGAVLGSSLDLAWTDSGAEVLGAWAFGVLAIPVPAGIGIRELYFSVFVDSAAGANLALLHRGLTLLVDVVVGVVGVRMVLGRTESVTR